MVTATELTRPELALHWHEAVAIVAETAATLLARGITSVPELASIVITPDGRLHVLEEGPPGAAPVPRLGEMLDVLLPSSACPPELRQLVDRSMADPPAFATIEAFANALAFFERPGRDELLADVAARGAEAALEARAHTELERLEARTRNVPRKTANDASSEQTPSHHTHNKRRVVVLFAGSLLVSAVVGGVLALRAIDSEARERGAPGSITERVKARVDRIAQRGLEAVGLRTPAPPTPTSPEVVTPPRITSKPAKRAPRGLPVTISVRELAGAPVAPASVTPETLEPVVRERDEAVYTAEAENVEPAVLKRPHLPSRIPSDATSEEIGVLEIVVSATGAVEQVRLVSTSNRYQDRMIVAAAKAWRFAPAMKDGQPVRYRTRIRITL